MMNVLESEIVHCYLLAAFLQKKQRQSWTTGAYVAVVFFLHRWRMQDSQQLIVLRQSLQGLLLDGLEPEIETKLYPGRY